jgi:hypothetical protein
MRAVMCLAILALASGCAHKTVKESVVWCERNKEECKNRYDEADPGKDIKGYFRYTYSACIVLKIKKACLDSANTIAEDAFQSMDYSNACRFGTTACAMESDKNKDLIPSLASCKLAEISCEKAKTAPPGWVTKYEMQRKYELENRRDGMQGIQGASQIWQRSDRQPAQNSGNQSVDNPCEIPMAGPTPWQKQNCR